MWLGTFHSIGVRVLRRHAELVGLKSNFTILDTDDQTRLIKQLLQAEGIDDKKWPARVLSGIIQRWKDRALTPDKVSGDDAGEFANGKAAEIYTPVPGAARRGERRRFRRPGDALRDAVAAASRRAGAVSPPLPPHPGRRVPGHQRGAVSVAAAAGAGHRRTSAASATTTSRSTAGAAPRSATSCASRRISPAPPSSGWSATTARRRTSWPPPRT